MLKAGHYVVFRETEWLRKEIPPYIRLVPQGSLSFPKSCLGSRPSPNIQPVCALILGSLAARTIRNKYLWLIRYFDIFLIVIQTKTGSLHYKLSCVRFLSYSMMF